MSKDAQKLPGLQQDTETQPQPRSYISTHDSATARVLTGFFSSLGIECRVQQVLEGSNILHEIFIDCEALYASMVLSNTLGRPFFARPVAGAGGVA
jgi:hypothetical protein